MDKADRRIMSLASCLLYAGDWQLELQCDFLYGVSLRCLWIRPHAQFAPISLSLMTLSGYC
eukprot:1441167-Amphidinium_carterae.2